MDEELNHQAYEDVVRCLPPSMPDNEEYMRSYSFWRSLQVYPEDLSDYNP